MYQPYEPSELDSYSQVIRFRGALTEGGLGLEQFEDLSGMRPHISYLPGTGDLALRANEIGHPAGPVLVLVVRWARRFPRLAHLVGRVRNQAELEILGFAELPLCLGRVVGDPDDLGAGLVELWGSITEPLAFEASARGIGDRVPPEDGPLTP